MVKTVTLCVLAALALAAAIAIGGWQLGWWLKSSAQGHINHIQRQTYGFQTAQLQDMEQVYAQIAGLKAQEQAQPQNADALNSQVEALTIQFCTDHDNANKIDIPIRLQEFAQANC